MSTFFRFRTPAEARTLDTLIKSQVLYQLSYGCIVFCFAGAKVLTIFESTKFRTYFFCVFPDFIGIIDINQPYQP